MTMSGRGIGARIEATAAPLRREILIFEPSAGGHEMHYVGIVAAALAEAGLGPLRLVTTDQALHHESTAALRARRLFTAIDAVDPAAIAAPALYRLYGAAARQYRETVALARYVEAHGGAQRFRMIFIAFLDSASLVPLALGRYPFGRVPFAGIAIRPTYHLRAAGVAMPLRWKGPPERAIYHRLFRNPHLAALFTIDPYFAGHTADPRVVTLPDPAEFAGAPVPGAIRRRLGIAEDAVTVLIYGHLDRRKGFAPLIRAVARARRKAPIVLIAAGRQHPELMGPLPEPETSALRAQGGLVELDHYISPEEEHALFQAADMVWVCYGRRYVGMSGVMVKAGQAGKPIIAAPSGIIGETVRTHGVGVTVDPVRIDGIAAALTRLAKDADLRHRLGAAGRRRFGPHSPAAFARPIVERLTALLPSETDELARAVPSEAEAAAPQ